MPKLTEEQIRQARSIDLLDYLTTHEPNNVRMSKGRTNEYFLVEHDSLKMSNGKWFRHSTQQGGHSALDFLIKIRGIPFADAVETLTGKSAASSLNPPPAKILHKLSPPQKPFVLPAPNKNNDRVIAYLRGRGIDKEVINRCIRTGILYENINHRCVFVGRDENNVPKYASERGTADGWKKDIARSNKWFCFALPPEQPLSKATNKTLAVFEAPVDLLAHHTIHKIGQTGWDGHRLSLGGISSKGLFGFMERHPEIADVELCLDSDQPGKEATERIIKELLGDNRYAGMKITVVPAPFGTDYADTLLAMKQLNNERNDINRHQTAF